MNTTKNNATTTKAAQVKFTPGRRTTNVAAWVLKGSK